MPKGWRRAALGDVLAQVTRPRAVHRAATYPLLGVRWYGKGCHLHGTVPGAELKTPTLNQVRANDITYNKMWVSKGALAVVPAQHDGLYATTEYPTFECALDEAEPRYLRWALSSPELIQVATERCRGTTSRARLNPRDFLALRLRLPPLSEQRKIAAVLESLHDAAEASQAVIEQLQVVRKTMMSQLLRRGAPGRHTALKQSACGLIPRRWEVAPLSAVCDFLDERRVPIKAAARAPGPYPYYGASGVIDHVAGYLFDETLVLLAEDGANIRARSSPIAWKVSGKCWVNNHAHVLRPQKGLDVDFLIEYLESLDYEQFSTGTAQPKLNQTVCRNLPVVCPPLAEQREIGQLGDTLRRRQSIEETELVTLRASLRALQSALLSGERRV